MDNVILIGKHKTIEVFKQGGWVDGEQVPEQKVAEIRGISNPMNYKTLQSFEGGKYTTQDQVFYSKDTIDIKGTHTYMFDRLGNKVKYMIDDVKCWDDADLVKYILKRCLDGQ